MADETYKIYDIELIDRLTLDILNKPDTPEAIMNLILSLDENQDADTARRLSNKIMSLIGPNKAASGLYPALYDKYVEYADLLKFVFLTSLPDPQVEVLFRERLITALRRGLKVLDQIQLYIITYTMPILANRFSQILIKAISYSEEKIGQSQIHNFSQGKDVDPTLGNWIKSYTQTLIRGETKISLQESEYFSQNKDFLALSPGEKNILEQAIKIYDFLRFPGSGVFAILPEKSDLEGKKIGLAKPISRGQIDKPGRSKATPADFSDEILQAYQGDAKQQKTIANFQEKLKKTAGNDPFKLQEEFYKGVQNQDLVKTVACLKLLSLNGQLLDFIKNDPKLNKFLAATWAKAFGQALASEFVKNPGQPKFVRLFLRYVLCDRLKMSESDAGRIAMQIGNVFAAQGKPEYNRLAYLDVGSKQFKWFEN